MKTNTETDEAETEIRRLDGQLSCQDCVKNENPMRWRYSFLSNLDLLRRKQQKNG